MGFKITSKGKQSVKDSINAKARERRSKLAAETGLNAKVSVMVRNDLSPNLQLEYRSPASLYPANRRVRRSSANHVESICRSVSAMGFCLPVLITSDGTIIDGHVRWEAARRLGMETVPCIVIDHLSKDEVRLLSVSLNRIAENGSGMCQLSRLSLLILKRWISIWDLPAFWT